MKKDTSTPIRIIVWLALIGVLSIASMGIWLIVDDHTSITSLKWLQLLQTLGMFLLPPLLTAWLCCKQPMHWLHLDKGMSWKTVLFAIIVMLIALPGINLLSTLNQQLTLPSFLEPIEELMRSQEDAANQLTESFLQVNTLWGLLTNIALMALLPAIAEELTFRGVMMSLFEKSDETQEHDKDFYEKQQPKHSISTRSHIAIWVTACIFSFVHFQFYGFIPRMLMGAMFGYMLVMTGSIWVPMLMHFTNNAIAVLSYYLTYNYALDEDMFDSFGTSSTLWVGILSIIFVVSALVVYPRLTTPRKD